MSVLNKPYFHDEAAAFAKLESVVWPDGAVCPHCGNTKGIYDLAKTRIGLRKCGAKECRKQFTVRVGTVYESSHIPLHKWLQATYLLCCSKKGCSSHQLHRVLGITYKSAWFMSHRIREAMRSGELAPMGGAGSSGIVEADETFIGRKKGAEVKRGAGHKHAVLSLVERGGKVRSVHVDNVKAETLVPILNENIAQESRVMTDDAATYYKKLEGFAGHDAVNHAAKEYVRHEDGKPVIHTNTIEGYFSIFKRGMKGIYQHCGEQHLHRYLAEFDFRYNNRIRLGIDDEQRTDNAVAGAKGKRLTYTVADQQSGENEVR